MVTRYIVYNYTVSKCVYQILMVYVLFEICLLDIKANVTSAPHQNWFKDKDKEALFNFAFISS